MIITYHSVSSFKVQFGDTVLAFNPVSKESQHKPTRFGADVVLISANHPDFNGISQVTSKEKTPFVVRGPGEYEVGGTVIQGFPSFSDYDGEHRHNTIYAVELEGMTLCFLGALNESKISQEAMEVLDEIDLLFVPIGGTGVLDATDAYKLAVSLEPKLIIPMLADEKNGDGISRFLEEGGKEKSTPVDKLTVKQKDVAGKEGEIVVLNAK